MARRRYARFHRMTMTPTILSATPASMTAPLSQTFIAALKMALPDIAVPVGLHEPVFTGNERTYVQQCLDSGWVSYNGAFGLKFEEMLTDLTGAGACAAVASGTVAIEMALR